MNSPLRKPTNLSIDSDLLEDAKAMRSQSYGQNLQSDYIQFFELAAKTM